MKSFSIIREGAFDLYENRELGLVYWYLMEKTLPLEKGKDENRLSVSERFVLIMLHDIITEIEKTAEEHGVDLRSVSYGMKEDP